jgi:putative phosphoesterase
MNSSLGFPLRIGVLSDTHLTDSGDAQAFLLDLIENVLAPVDLILHAGDLVAPDLLSVFDAYSFHAVRGNMDPVIADVPLKKIINVGGFTIGLIHGWGPPEGLEERAFAEFSSVTLDCLVYGHSHRPACYRQDGVLFFNPGSATDKRSMDHYSVGLLEIGDDIQGTIIRLD